MANDSVCVCVCLCKYYSAVKKNENNEFVGKWKQLKKNDIEQVCSDPEVQTSPILYDIL